MHYLNHVLCCISQFIVFLYLRFFLAAAGIFAETENFFGFLLFRKKVEMKEEKQICCGRGCIY